MSTTRASSRVSARSGKLAVGEGYQAGEWSSPDLPGLVALLARNQEQVFGRPPLSVLAALTRVIPRIELPRGLRRAERDIHAHYDLGNAFFSLWLDESMTYSCALFETPEADARRGAAVEVPRARRGDAHRPRRPRARDRHRLGRLRDAPRARARLPRHHRDDLARAARARDRARARGRARRSHRRRLQRLPQAAGLVLAHRLGRDDRGDRPPAAAAPTSRRSTGCSRPTASPASSRSSSRISATAPTGGSATGSASTSSRAGCCPRSRPSRRPRGAPPT